MFFLEFKRECVSYLAKNWVKERNIIAVPVRVCLYARVGCFLLSTSVLLSAVHYVLQMN